MATAKKSTELAPVENFALTTAYDGLDPELAAELKDQMDDLDDESGINCRTIKIPSGGSLAFTVQRANVRADGTLVMDIRPIGAVPETVESYGPVTLTLDGAPGVLDLDATLGEITVRVIVTGERNEQAVVQVVDAAGEIVETSFVSPERTVIDTWLDVTSGATTWSEPVVTFTPPERSTPGTVRVSGALTVDGVTSELDQVIARWSLPLA